MTEIKKDVTVDNFWDEIKRRADELNSADKLPLIVIDLDGTLVDYSMRTYSIFQEMPSKFKLNDDIKDKILSIKPTEFHYHPRENLAALGFNGDGTLDKLASFWEKNFLSSYFLHYDILLLAQCNL